VCYQLTIENKKVKNNNIAMLRLPAFLIDFIIIMASIIGIIKLGELVALTDGTMEIEWLMLFWIPFMFFLYWSLGINIGKRIFRLSILDADSRSKPTTWQLFKRSLLFSLGISLNVIFIFPIFISKRNQGFHDMLANTIVVKNDNKLFSEK